MLLVRHARLPVLWYPEIRYTLLTSPADTIQVLPDTTLHVLQIKFELQQFKSHTMLAPLFAIALNNMSDINFSIKCRGLEKIQCRTAQKPKR